MFINNMKKEVIIGIVVVIVIIIGFFVYNNMNEVPDVEIESETDEASYMDVSAQEAKNLIDTNLDLIIIDVSPHYDKGHLPGAIHYYLGDGSLDKAIPNLDKNAEYLVYCHVDSVAISGAQKLIDAGVETVYRLEGNYGGWVAAGYDVEV